MIPQNAESQNSTKQPLEDPDQKRLYETADVLLQEFLQRERRKTTEPKIITFLNDNLRFAFEKLMKKEVRKSFLIIKTLESLSINILDQISETNSELAQTLQLLQALKNDTGSFKIEDLLQFECTAQLKKVQTNRTKSFLDRMISFLVIFLNNLSCLMGSKSKGKKAMVALIKTIEIRLRHLDHTDSFYSLALCFLNVGYLFYQQGEDNNSHLCINKGISILEEIDKFCPGKSNYFTKKINSKLYTLLLLEDSLSETSSMVLFILQ